MGEKKVYPGLHSSIVWQGDCLAAIMTSNKDLAGCPFVLTRKIPIMYSFLDDLSALDVKLDSMMMKLETIKQVTICVHPTFSSTISKF